MEANMSINGGEGSTPIGLELELGRCSLQQSTNYGFTMFQLQELQLQSLIYKHLEAGIPVPYQLVIPIWKSVASSSHGPNITGVYQPYPTLLGCGPLSLECRNDMDSEPWRCRRTDGKKWRCGKEAVPDQKYCERHIHRGRQRSRKLVEASQGITSSSTSATTTGACTNLSISLQLNGTTTISHSSTG